ncbi:MAG TPA: hypothetical protein VKV37_00515 [Ktedonobacteraceae bacterium]|nr:hypothetical protein [Ktedonobacteraceae bacterium]
MITQTIKRWLSKLFAWWPWGRSRASGYSHLIGNLNAGIASEGAWRATRSGPLPQPGTTSVAVEHEQSEIPPEANRPTGEERPDHPPQQSPAVSEEHTTSRHAAANSAGAAKEVAAHRRGTPAPTPEQQLRFLQYLVRRGLINEGFAEGQVPYQYSKLRAPEHQQK